MVIHNTAIIDSSAVIEENVEIGPYTVIGPQSIIKKGTRVHGHVVIEYADIGNNCEIFNFASIGKCPQDMKYRGEKTKIVIGEGTTIRECVTLNRGTIACGQTVIGKNCLLMSCAHIAHDCFIGNNVIVGYSTGVAGHVKIGSDAILSSSIGIHQFCRIGESVMIGAGSMVSMDIVPYVMVQGDRAALVGLNIVGLKRKKLEFFEIENIKKAYKILFMSRLTLEKAIAELEKSLMSSHYVENIVIFAKASQRGIMRPRRL
ncbi:MAG: acyl-ACP--UDP-N-acetylglucosamine O-acyltransferase [Endomicrobium sp.]|jgi:UDP-N-acetylglucosamine acyltransferase|nr:acyl-ACP--UDP-N-acetylglucosamine O-acyltransferase [Endomicrobium sp.]